MAPRHGNQARTTKPGKPRERQQFQPSLALTAAIPAAAGAQAEEREFPLLTEGQGKPQREELLARSWDASKLNKSAPSPSETHDRFPPPPLLQHFPLSICRHPGAGCSWWDLRDREIGARGRRDAPERIPLQQQSIPPCGTAQPLPGRLHGCQTHKVITKISRKVSRHRGISKHPSSCPLPPSREMHPPHRGKHLPRPLEKLKPWLLPICLL